MKHVNVNKLYKDIYSFCVKKGLIRELSISLRKSESERFVESDIHKSGLSVLDAVHCLIDKGRTIPLLEEIKKTVRKGDCVMEAGLGTGILSFYSSQMSRKVTSCEINNDVFLLVNGAREYLQLKGYDLSNLFISKMDARKIKLDDMIDVLISENIYTGMFFEKQIDIVKALRKKLRKGGVVIPSGIESSLSLCNINITNSPQTFFVLNEIKERPSILSGYVLYDSINFRTVKVNNVNKRIVVKIKSSGLVNSILVCSDVLLPSGRVIGREDTDFMNNDIVIPLDKVVAVRRGDNIQVTIKYSYGSSPSDAKIILKKL